jgi:hypothetical protein
MRIFKMATLAALTLGVVLAGTVSAFAQADESSSHKKVLGYQDPETGVFRPVEYLIPEATITPTTGTIQLTITITLKTAVPTGGSVLCSTGIAASSTSLTTGTGVTYSESSTSAAKVTGTTATCTVTTPYSWVLPPASSTTVDSLTGSYTVSILPAPSTTITIATLQGRSSSSLFLTSKTIPAVGTVSKYAIAATL